MQTIEHLDNGGYQLNTFDGENWSRIFFVTEDALKEFFYKKEMEEKNECSSKESV